MAIEIELIPHLERAKLKAEKEAIEREISVISSMLSILSFACICHQINQRGLNKLLCQQLKLSYKFN